MPSKAGQQKHDPLSSSGDFVSSLELKRSSRHRSSSKTSKDKALIPPQADQTAQRFRDSKDETKFHLPPHSSEFGKSHNDVQIGNNQQDQMGVYMDGELIRHMSSLPGYLQRGDNSQDKVLSFGVLDWDRLEKWKHKQNRISSHSGASTSASSSSSSVLLSSSTSSGRTSSECSKDSTSVPSSKTKTAQGSGSRKKQPADSGESAFRKVEASRRASAAHNNEKVSSSSIRDSSKHQRSRLGEQPPPTRFVKDKSVSSGSASDVNNSSKKKASNAASLNMEPVKPEDRVKDLTGLDHNPFSGQHHHIRQESIVLLLPKDFSKSEFLDGGSQRASSDANSAELNSFSDVFSIEEFHLEEPVPDIQHSCPIPYKTETDLDSYLENLVHVERMPLLSDHLSLSDPSKDKDSPQDEAKVKHNDNTVDSRGSVTTLETSPIFHSKSSEMKSSSAPRDNSPAPRPFSFDMGRITRSLSFRETSAAAALPRLSYSSIKSGPTTKTPPPVDARHGSSADNSSVPTPTPGRARSSPLRRLLDPLLKPRGGSSKLSGSGEELKSLGFKTISNGGVENNHQSSGKSGSLSSTMVQAVLYLTVNNGVPVFKFLVESRNEILACSVKRLNPIRSDDPSWLYTFSSVNKTKRKTGMSWMYQGGSKGRAGSELSYTVIGQLKVHEPPFPATKWGDGDVKEKLTMTTEAVLYGVDLSKVDTSDMPEDMTNKELGAIVIQNSTCIAKDDGRRADEYSGENEIVVILPGGIHSLPIEGGPSTLISRWRSGGECDCGGWDEGCKLQILSNNVLQGESKTSRHTRFSYYTDRQHDCSLFLQGASSSGKLNDQRPVFTLAANGDGAVYAIEYNDAISSLQAFAIAVAVLSKRDEPNDIFNSASYRHSELPKVHVRSKSAIFLGEGTAKFATNPPHSPVGRA